MSDRGIKALDTNYNGHLFRSRTEARWAVFFDAAGVRYEYEPQGVELSTGRYLPDFYLPDAEMWFEVKGAWDQVGGLKKYHELAVKSQKWVVLGVGNPDPFGNLIFVCREEIRISVRDQACGEDAWFVPHTCYFGERDGRLVIVPNVKFNFGAGPTSLCFQTEANIRQESGAYQAAQNARFEHGQTPKVNPR